MTLVEFLLARIAEDEEAANWASTDYSEYWDLLAPDTVQIDKHLAWQTGERAAAHVARWDPVRVLAECEAKRRIVELCANHSDHGINQGMSERLLRIVALGYADHPAFDAAWLPEPVSR